MIIWLLTLTTGYFLGTSIALLLENRDIKEELLCQK